MRGLSTAAIVAAVVVVGLLAIADALRSSDPAAQPVPAPTTTRASSATLPDTLRDELVIGRLIYSDAECRLHTLELPDMVNEPVGETRCRFASNEGWVLAEGERLSPNWRYTARCEGGRIVIRDADTRAVDRRVEGCAADWRPPAGNRLTWARGDVIYERGQPLLTRRELRAAGRRHPFLRELPPDFELRVRVTDLRWVSPDRIVVSLRIRDPYGGDFLGALFEGRRVVALAPGVLTGWFPSPAGSFVAASSGTILTAEGDVVETPTGLPAGTAVAFSPDERWLAYVTGRSVYLIGTPRNAEPGRLIRLPIPARDLAWERISQVTRVAGLGTG
jgi:hypothetical protein